MKTVEMASISKAQGAPRAKIATQDRTAHKEALTWTLALWAAIAQVQARRLHAQQASTAPQEALTWSLASRGMSVRSQTKRAGASQGATPMVDSHPARAAIAVLSVLIGPLRIAQRASRTSTHRSQARTAVAPHALSATTATSTAVARLWDRSARCAAPGGTARVEYAAKIAVRLTIARKGALTR